MTYVPYPKMLYHPKTGAGTIVQDKDEHEALLNKWAETEQPDEVTAPRRGRPPLVKDVDA